MSFKDIEGQDEVIKYLKSILQKEHLPPTLLFYGPNGVGKKKTAITFAKALNCRGGKDDSCDNCRNCNAIESNVHPNVKVIGTEGLGIDDIRSAIDGSYIPIEGGYKINIFLNVESATEEAFNSMLKYFEEPPEKTINVLIAETLDNIPETILSRSVELRFKPLSKSAIKKVLGAKGVELNRAEVIAHLSNGSLERAEIFLEEGTLEKRKELLKGVLLFFRHEETLYRVLTLFRSFYGEAKNENVSLFFDEILTLVSDMLLISVLKDSEHVFNVDLLGFIADKFFAFSRRKLGKISFLLEEGKKKLLTNANPLHIMISVLMNLEEVAK